MATGSSNSKSPDEMSDRPSLKSASDSLSLLLASSTSSIAGSASG